jgi:hypothetical protein
MYMSASFEINELSEELRNNIETMDVYDWNLKFNEFLKGSFNRDFIQEVFDKQSNDLWYHPDNDDEELVMMSMVMWMTLNELPTLFLDPIIEKAIEDTTTDILRTQMPFPSFFLAKRFPYKDGFVMGIYAIDMEKFGEYCLVEDGMPRKEALKEMKNVIDSYSFGDKFPKVQLYALYVDKKRVHIYNYTIEDIHSEKVDKLGVGVMKRAMFYALNVSNLISAYVDLEKPNDPKKDIRLTNKYDPRDRERTKPKYSYIRVYGDLKKYSESYNKEKRRYTTSNEAIIVRGHFRHYKSDRYKAVKGKTLWIPPYIKGSANEELRRRLIKVMM